MTEIQNLEDRIQENTNALSSLVAAMQSQYSPSHLEEFKALQETLKGLQAQLEAARSTAGGAIETTTVNLLRGGKSDQAFEVRVGTTLGALIDQLGWDGDLSFRRRVSAGVTEVINNPEEFVLEAGEHELFVTHKVAAG